LFQLLEPDEPLREGKIRDSNKTTLIAQLQEFGYPVIDLKVARDTYVNSSFCYFIY